MIVVRGRVVCPCILIIVTWVESVEVMEVMKVMKGMKGIKVMVPRKGGNMGLVGVRVEAPADE